jgi:hypothetical protein
VIIVSTINPSSYRIYRTMTGCKRCTILAIGKSNALTVRGGCSSVKRGKRTMPSDINKRLIIALNISRANNKLVLDYLIDDHDDVSQIENKDFDKELESLLAMLEGEEPECECEKKLSAAAKLCEIYFNIAAKSIGEDEVIRRMNEAVGNIKAAPPETEVKG